MTSGSTPASCKLVENVRRRSWSVQGVTFESIVSNFVSIVALLLLQPENPVPSRPKTWPIAGSGRFGRLDAIVGVIEISCGVPPFILSAVIVMHSAPTSLQSREPISVRRQPVSKQSRTIRL